MIKIEDIHYYLPNDPIHNDYLGSINPSWDMSVLYNKTGVGTRYYASDDETALDMSIKACEKLFKNKPELREIIDGIFCTQSNDYIMPPNSSILHGVLNLSEKVFAYDFNLACSGFVYGLSMSHGLISGGIAKIYFID